MTKKLYLDQPYAQEFEGTVVRSFSKGPHTLLTLDSTLFYPTAGGQNHDTGTLTGSFGSCRIVDVYKDEEDPQELLHVIEGDIPEVGDRVVGLLDWERRFRHMQWHTAQHLMSQAFFRIDPRLRTVSVSFSSELCTVDFEGNPTPEEINQAERSVNRKCYENLPLRAFTIDESELSNYALRREPKVHGKIRLVGAGDWELAACGAPHLARTAEALPIKILKWENIRAGLTRITYKAGLSALEDYQLAHGVSKGLAVTFSTQIRKLPERIALLQAQLEEQRATTVELAGRVADQILKEAQAKGLKLGEDTFLFFEFDPVEVEIQKRIMRQLGKEGHHILLTFLNRPEKTEVTLIGTEGVTHHMGELLKEVFQTVPGKGGGRADMGRCAISPDYKDVFKHKLLELLNP